jgi:uncharacterized protein (UPF0333 family)
MGAVMFAWTWVTNKLRGPHNDERGQTSIEYVLVVLAVVLFLVAAAAAMTGVLGTAVSTVSTWVVSLTAPPVP